MTEIQEYTQTEAALADLRQRHEGVVYDVTVPKQMKLAKEARAEIRTLRTGLEKRRVEIKAPALERCRLIDAEAKRITAELVQLESPIDEAIKAEEARKESERLAALEAERQRVEAIQQRIADIRNLPATLVGKPSVVINGQLAKLREAVPTEDEFAEQTATAQDAHTAAVARIEQQLQAQVEHEAEQKRIQQERSELERLRKEAEERRLADEAKAAAERAEADRKAQEERDRIAAEQRAKEEAERAERERLEAIERGKQMKAAAEERERLAKERVELEAQQKAERERQAAEQKRLDEEAARLQREREAAAAKAEADRLANLGLREAAQAAVDYFEGGPGIVPGVIQDLRAALANDEAAAKPARTKRSAAA